VVYFLKQKPGNSLKTTVTIFVLMYLQTTIKSNLLIFIVNCGHHFYHVKDCTWSMGQFAEPS